ncbi:hypothetical protein D4R30_00610 [archaeon]|nr:MAG: hypothetical protein D4R30_00610 [archaeon]
MNIRFYFDHDASPKALVRALRARAVDIETAREARMTECDDREHLEYAASQGRVLYTFNRGHFCRLHIEFTAAGRAHAGLVVSQQQHYSVGEQMRRLLKLAAGRTAEEMQNRLEFLGDWS